MVEYLKPAFYIDSSHPSIKKYSRFLTKGMTDNFDIAIKLYYAVRDEFPYNPYALRINKDTYRASYILSQGQGYCIQKAILLAALARAAGIPGRVRFANVRNHLIRDKIKNILKTDLFVFHGYNELFINDKWVKATPAFDIKYCEKFEVQPLEFNARDDSILQPFDRNRKRSMEYIHDYGPFNDLPYDLMIQEFITYYPHLKKYIENDGKLLHEAIENNSM